MHATTAAAAAVAPAVVSAIDGVRVGRVGGDRTPPPDGDFYRHATWSPDASCLLTATDGRRVRLWEVHNTQDEEVVGETHLPCLSAGALASPPATGQSCVQTLAPPPPVSAGWSGAPGPDPRLVLTPAYDYFEAERTRDLAWYPPMASADPGSCVFAVAAGGSPVRLHDATTGNLRATYTPRHQGEFLDPPHAVAWTAGGRGLLAGGARAVTAFDPTRPAEPPLCNVSVRDLPPLGVVSCLAASPVRDGCSGMGGGVVVVGSFNGALLLLPSARGGGGGGGGAAGLCARDATVLAPRGGTGPASGGVMCVRVAADGVTVVAGARRSAAVGVWDIRALRRGGGGGTTTGAALLYELPVDAGSLQRLHLDVSDCGRWVVAGDAGGGVSVFSLSTGAVVARWAAAPPGVPVNAVTFCPGVTGGGRRLLVATTAGGRRWVPPWSDSDSEDDHSGGSRCSGASGCSSGDGSTGGDGPNAGSGAGIAFWQLAGLQHV